MLREHCVADPYLIALSLLLPRAEWQKSRDA